MLQNYTKRMFALLLLTIPFTHCAENSQAENEKIRAAGVRLCNFDSAKYNGPKCVQYISWVTKWDDLTKKHDTLTKNYNDLQSEQTSLTKKHDYLQSTQDSFIKTLILKGEQPSEEKRDYNLKHGDLLLSLENLLTVNNSTLGNMKTNLASISKQLNSLRDEGYKQFVTQQHDEQPQN